MNTQVAPKVEFQVAPEQPDPFDETITLPHEITLYIPSTVDVNQVDLNLQAEMVEEVSTSLSATYGGVTANAPGKGGWPSRMGMVWESVTPITVYVRELDFNVKAHIMRLARHVRDTMRQESVLFVVDGQGHLV